MLPHLHNGWQTDQAILSEEDRVVVSDFSLSNRLLFVQINVKLLQFSHLGHSIWARLGSSLYENGRSAL